MDKSQAGVKITRRNINNLRYTDDNHSNGRKWRTKEPLEEDEKGQWKSWLEIQHSENKDHGVWSHHFMANRWGKVETVTDFIFLVSQITVDGDCSHEIKRDLLLGRKAKQCIKKQKHHFINKGLYSQSYGFSSSQVQMWELDLQAVWAPKNWCFWTVVLEKTLESPLDCKEIQPVHPKDDQSWVVIGRTDAEAEAPILWPPDVKSWLWCWERLKAKGEGGGRGGDG